MDLEGGIHYLLGEWRDLGKRLMATERERVKSKDRSKLLIRQVYEEERTLIDAREIYHNSRVKAFRGIKKEMTNM